MIDRGSDRDTWKLEHWDEYIAGVNFEIPETIGAANDGTLLIFKNSSKEEFDKSMKEITAELLK